MTYPLDLLATEDGATLLVTEDDRDYIKTEGSMALDTVNALAALAEAKVHLGVAAGDTTYDTMIENLLNGAAYACNKLCNRLIIKRAHTEYRDGDGSASLYVQNPPLTTLTSLHISTDSPRAYGAGQLIASTAILTDQESGLVRLLDTTFSKGAQTVKLVYTGGWDLVTPTLPWDLRNAYLDLVKWEFERWKGNRIAFQQQSIQAISVNLQTTIPEDILSRLLQYRFVPQRYRYYA